MIIHLNLSVQKNKISALFSFFLRNKITCQLYEGYNSKVTEGSPKKPLLLQQEQNFATLLGSLAGLGN